MKLRIERTQGLVLVFATMLLMAPEVAFGQVGGTGQQQLICNANAPGNPTLRSEGYTEQVSDITISCTGGVAPSLGATIPQFNITIYFNTAVTSRLLPVANVSNNIAEALLLIDEPNSGLPAPVPGFGAAAGLNVCATPTTGCVQYVSKPTGSSINVATDTPQGNTATTPGKNVFQGIVSGNSVVFYGVPILPPGNGTRVLRMTNLRVNASSLTVPDESLALVQASISISGATSLFIQNSVPYVATVSGSLATSLEKAVACGTCTSVNVTPATALSFREKFKTAFKTRVMAQDNIPYAGQNGTPGSNGFPAQNVPGAIYNSESGLVAPVGAGQTAGLAQAGTRLKAVFSNIPAGVRMLVSVANIDANGMPVPAPAVPGGIAANIGTAGYARLTSSETGGFDLVADQGNGPGGIPMQEIPVANGSATAIWEVINTNPNELENLRFEVYTYTPSGASVAPITANLSYAAAPPSFPAGSGSQASADLPVPRFVPDASAARLLSSATMPNLGITKTHGGPFVQGQLGAVYQLTVMNNATVSTDGSTVTVADTLPLGMAATAMSGAGWTCSAATFSCTRSDALAGGASYPAITVAVNVAGNAASPLVNRASVSGGGSPSASVDDITTVMPAGGDAVSFGPNWIELSCPAQAPAGGVVSCAVNLRLNSTPADSYAFTATVTPVATAPPLTTGHLGFTQYMGGAAATTDGTNNAISVSWTNSEIMGWPQLASIAFIIPATAAPGQAYKITLSGVSASYGGNKLPISAGLPAFVAIPAPGQPSCNTNVVVTPGLRGEGYTEQTGDITLTCSGGTAPEVGTTIPRADFTIWYNVPVTSRLLPQAGASNASEVLMIIDEPGSGLRSAVAGFGPEAPQNLCATPTAGCTEYVSSKAGSTVPVATDTPQGTSATAPGRNVFQGVIDGNSVTFYGIPLMAPGNSARVFRITNVRVNSSAMHVDGSLGARPVVASLSMSGAPTWTLTNNLPIVGYVSPGLTSSATAAGTLSQCNSQVLTPAGQISFAEKFGTAFKTRVKALTNTPYAGQSGTLAQNIPGMIYQSESYFVLPVASGERPGLANFGSRLKAQFQVPAGVRLFVSVANVQSNGLPVAAPAVIGGSAANTNISYAQLTASETGAFSAVPSNASAGGVPVVELPVTNGVATAVWEVVNTNPNEGEALQFGVFTSYESNPAQNLPGPGSATVNLSFAAAPPSFSAAPAPAASATLPIPRFAAGPFSARDLFNITRCTPLVASTATGLTANQAAGSNQFIFTATVTSSMIGAGSPAGAVTFYDNGNAMGGSTTTLTAAGIATFLTPVTTGSHKITAVFTPSGPPFTASTSPEVGFWFGKTSTTIQITSNRDPSFAGQAVTFTAEVTGEAPTGSVQFMDGAQLLRIATLAGGRASVTAAFANVGVHDIFATYTGDARNGDVTARFGQRVERATQVLNLASSKPSLDFGQPLTLTATLTTPPPPGVAAATGSVQFQEGETMIGSAPVAAGISTLTVSNLLPGPHKIFTIYSGDASWYGAHSEAVTVTVASAPVMVTLASSATITGLTFSAALTPAMCAGSVEFVDTTDKNTLGSVRPANGPVQLPLTAEVAAKIAGHTIIASYSGSGGFAGGTSNAIALPALRNSAGGPSLAFAPDELVNLFGNQLGSAPRAAEANTLPKTLDGLLVNVTDASGAVLASDLTYVSASQVNFIMPAGLASGPGLVSVVRNGVVIGAVPVRLGLVAPGLFDSPQITRTEAGDVYLVLYATGIRNASGRPAVTCTVNGRSLGVAFAGPHRDFAGLDQVNVLLPADLRGSLDVSLLVDGQTSNSVNVRAQ